MLQLLVAVLQVEKMNSHSDSSGNLAGQSSLVDENMCPRIQLMQQSLLSDTVNLPSANLKFSEHKHVNGSGAVRMYAPLTSRCLRLSAMV